MAILHRRLRTAAAAGLAALALVGCATMRAAEARHSYLQAKLGPYVFPQTCMELWPTALRVVNSKGFPVVGADRERIGESAPDFLSSVISDGFSTRTTGDGGLVAETTWNQSVGTRYRIEGTPEGTKGCRVRYIVITGGAQGSVEETVGPDWSMLLDLVAAVDPATAGKIEEGEPKG